MKIIDSQSIDILKMNAFVLIMVIFNDKIKSFVAKKRQFGVLTRLFFRIK